MSLKKVIVIPVAALAIIALTYWRAVSRSDSNRPLKPVTQQSGSNQGSGTTLFSSGETKLDQPYQGAVGARSLFGRIREVCRQRAGTQGRPFYEEQELESTTAATLLNIPSVSRLLQNLLHLVDQDEEARGAFSVALRDPQEDPILRELLVYVASNLDSSKPESDITKVIIDLARNGYPSDLRFAALGALWKEYNLAALPEGYPRVSVRFVSKNRSVISHPEIAKVFLDVVRPGEREHRMLFQGVMALTSSDVPALRRLAVAAVDEINEPKVQAALSRRFNPDAEYGDFLWESARALMQDKLGIGLDEVASNAAALQRTLEAADPSMRRMALSALVSEGIRNPSSINNLNLISILPTLLTETSDPVLTLLAIEGIGKVGEPSFARSLLVPLITDSSWKAIAALNALGSLPGDETGALIKLISEDAQYAEQIRHIAARLSAGRK